GSVNSLPCWQLPSGEDETTALRINVTSAANGSSTVTVKCTVTVTPCGTVTVCAQLVPAVSQPAPQPSPVPVKWVPAGTVSVSVVSSVRPPVFATLIA